MKNISISEDNFAINCQIVKSNYSTNNALALILMVDSVENDENSDDGFYAGEEYCRLTVNLPECNEKTIALDVNNCFREAKTFMTHIKDSPYFDDKLKAEEIWGEYEDTIPNEYVNYPLVKVNDNFINKVQSYEEYAEEIGLF